MKKFISLVTMFSLLIVCIDANSAPFQQSGDGLAEDMVYTIVPGDLTTKDGHNNISKVASVIDNDSSISFIDKRYKAAVNRLKQQAAAVKAYTKANHFNTEYCFLVDMSIPSGKKRFFVYNLKKDSVENSSLVAHGWGSETPDSDKLQFSNTPNSSQTSLGKYKIGYSYNGTFGLAYKLYGLDNTNSKAFERAIVLHSLSYVPDSETYPDNICNSAGCPMVSPSFLAVLSRYIKSSQKPVLLWIYN